MEVLIRIAFVLALLIGSSQAHAQAVQILRGSTGSSGSSSSSGLAGETTRTVALTTAMSTAQIQTAIDAIGKYIPNGVTVTIQFADGSYALTSMLTVKGFFGGGRLLIAGNQAESTSAHTTQAVALVGTSHTNEATLLIENCSTQVDLHWIKVQPNTVNDKNGILVRRSSVVNISYSYALGTNNNSGHGFSFQLSSRGGIYATFVNNCGVGVSSHSGSHIHSQLTSTGTSPANGLNYTNATGGVITL